MAGFDARVSLTCEGAPEEMRSKKRKEKNCRQVEGKRDNTSVSHHLHNHKIALVFL